MQVRVLFFGVTREITALGEECLDVEPGIRAGELLEAYRKRFPKLGEIGPALLLAVNQEVSGPLQVLKDKDEVAFLPPVSGG